MTLRARRHGATAVAGLLAALTAVAGALAHGSARADAGVRLVPGTGVRIETAALLLSGQEGGPLTFVAYAFAVPGAAGRTRMAVVLEADGRALLADLVEPRLRLELYVYAVGGQGLQDFLVQTVEVDLDATARAALADGGLRVYGELDLPAGESTLRVLLRNAATGALGLRSLRVSVPDLRPETPRLLTLLAPAAGPWVDAGPAPPATGPLAARPLLASEGEASLRLVGLHLPAAPLEARLELEAAGARAERAARVVARDAGPAPGLEILTLAWSPGDLEPGLYQARATLGPAPGLTTPPLEVVLVPPATAEAWPQLLAGRPPRATEPPPPERQEAASETGRQLRRRLEQELRRALAQLVSGPAAGVAALAQLETTALHQAGAEPDAVAAAEQRIYARLTREHPEALVPLLAAYETIFQEAQRERAYLMASHARQMVAALADLYIARSASPEARGLAAHALVLVGAALAAAGPGGTLGDRALQRAHDLDPGNATALYYLAMGSELRGDYRATIQWLQRLRELPQEAALAGLRLGVNHRRMGAEGPALRAWRAVLEAPAEEWVTAVAYQEIARLLIARDRLDEAADLLGQGIARLPRSEKLHLLAALVEDLRGEAAQARDRLSGLVLPLAGDASSRHRYGRLPYERLETERRTLARAANARRPVLASALGVAPAEVTATP